MPLLLAQETNLQLIKPVFWQDSLLTCQQVKLPMIQSLLFQDLQLMESSSPATHKDKKSKLLTE